MKKQFAFGMIETLVGLLIGMLVMLTVFSSISLQQALKRNAVHSDSAMAQTMTGLYFLSDDIKLGGLGFFNSNEFLCSAINIYYNGNIVSDGGLVTPVQITDGGNGSDQITVMHANNSLAGAPSRLLMNMASAVDTVKINLAAGAALNGLAMLAQPGTNTPCTVIQATNVDTSGSVAIVDHTEAGAQYNPPDASTTFTNYFNYDEQAVLINLDSLSFHTWRINNNQLQLVNNITGNIEVMADNVVYMHAEYGVANVGETRINEWVQATGDWANPDNDRLKRIRAVRVALITRNTLRDNSTAQNNVCDTTTAAPVTWAGSPAVDLSADPNWRCYRYQTLKTVVPVKNIIWGKVS